MDLPTQTDLFRVGRDEALRRNGKLTLEAIERDGSDINIDVAVSAATGDEAVAQLAVVSAGIYLDSARGRALDRVVFDRYGLLRKVAAPAVGSVVFQVLDGTGTPIANPSGFTIPAGTQLQSVDGTNFVTQVDQLFAMSAMSVTVAVRSVLAGADQQAGKNTITSIQGQVSGGPSSPNRLVVNNPLATAGACDEEEDDDLRNRARAFFLTARRGTLAAIEQGALAVAGVKTARAIEVLDALGRPARMVQLMITDAYTDQLAQLSTAVPAYDAQSQVLAANVFAGLDDYRAAGIYVMTQVAQTVMLPVAMRLAFLAGADPDEVALEARAAVVGYTNALQSGTNWVRDLAQAKLQTIPGLYYTGNEIMSPAGDIIAKPLQAIRTSMAIVSPVSAQTDRPLTVSSNPDAFQQVN